MRDAIMNLEGGRASSSSFEYFSTTGETTIGASSSTSFQHQAGVQYRQANVFLAQQITLFQPTAPVAESLPNTNGTSADIAIPANAVSSSSEVQLTLQSQAESAVTPQAPLPSNKQASDTFYSISLVDTSTSTAISTVSQPVTLTFHYTDADISGINESTLAAYRFDGAGWIPLPNNALNAATNTVMATTTHFSLFTLLGSASQVQPPPPPSGGGGGGGGGGAGAPPLQQGASVTFSGRAYPLSTVTILKDAQVAQTTVAGQDARFTMTLSGLTTGNYIFSIYTEDDAGYRSGSLTFPVSVTQGASTTVGGIFLTPTVRVDKTEVKRGEPISIFGQVAPLAELTITLNSEQEFFFKTVADNDGAYLYAFDTTPLELGQHLAKSKAVLDNEISPSSRAVAFTVGTKTTLTQPPSDTSAKGDVNGDSRVNLVDFSIFAYWYQRPSPPVAVDLNSDGKVDLVDFSIMAFYWTG